MSDKRSRKEGAWHIYKIMIWKGSSNNSQNLEIAICPWLTGESGTPPAPISLTTATGRRFFVTGSRLYQNVSFWLIAGFSPDHRFTLVVVTLINWEEHFFPAHTPDEFDQVFSVISGLFEIMMPLFLKQRSRSPLVLRLPLTGGRE
jgi:hypothetical protein